jgi:hypothetical protein
MKRLFALIALCAVISMSACMNFPIEGDCPKTPDSHYGKETIHGSFYGFNWDDNTREVRKANNGLGLAKVEYRTNFFYALISVFSLGAYVPVDVDYWVEAPKEKSLLPKKHGGTRE